MALLKKLLFPVLLLVLCAANLPAQTLSFLEPAGEWHDSVNWNTGNLPGISDTAIINNSRTVTITPGNPTALADTLRVGNQNSDVHFGSLRIEGDLNIARNMQVASAANAEGYVRHTSGTVSISQNLQIASTNAGAVAEYTLAGGTLSGSTANILVGTEGTGLFHVDGDGGSISFSTMEVGAGGTLYFTLGETGVTSIHISEKLSRHPSATLVVDRGMYDWSQDSELLLISTADNLPPWNAERVTLVGFEDPLPDVRHNEDGIILTALTSDDPIDPPPPPGPNIILFYVDDLGWQDTNLNQVDEPSPWETPNIERMAALAMNFPQAYSAAPSCVPSRVALMTGKHPARTGVTHVRGGIPPVGRISDSHMDPYYPARMNVEEVTIADALQQYGYRTGHIGKWHMAVNHGAFPGPRDQGFLLSSSTRGLTRRMEPDRLSDFATDAPDDPFRLDSDGRPYDAVTEDALDFMRDNLDAPFFLYLSHWLVHWPVQTRNRALLEYYCEKLGIPFPTDPGPVTTPGRTNPYYGAMVDTLDWSLGKIMNFLEETDDPRRPGQKLIDNTYLIFTSDNGGALRHAAEIITTNAPLSMGKTSAKEGGVRVPFLIMGPNIPAGVTSQELLNQLDLYPSILTLTGAPGDPEQISQFDGVDLTPYLFGEAPHISKADGSRRDTLYWHFPHILELHSAIRKGDFKLLKNYETNDYDLFRLYGDAGERLDWEEAINLANNPQYETIRNQLIVELESFLEGMNAAYPHKNPQYRNASSLTGFENMPVFLQKGYNAVTGMAYATFETGEGKTPVDFAYLLYTPNGGRADEEWFPVAAEVNQQNGLMQAPLPPDATHFLFNLVDENNFLVSSTGLEQTTFSAWLFSTFPDPDELSDPAISGLLADPLRMGVPNLVRYALAINASEDLAGRMPRLLFDQAGPRFRFPFVGKRDDLQIKVVVSNDLVDWDEVIWDSMIDGGEVIPGSWIELSDEHYAGENASARFFRLHINFVSTE